MSVTSFKAEEQVFFGEAKSHFERDLLDVGHFASGCLHDAVVALKRAAGEAVSLTHLNHVTVSVEPGPDGTVVATASVAVPKTVQAADPAPAEDADPSEEPSAA